MLKTIKAAQKFVSGCRDGVIAGLDKRQVSPGSVVAHIPSGTLYLCVMTVAGEEWALVDINTGLPEYILSTSKYGGTGLPIAEFSGIGDKYMEYEVFYNGKRSFVSSHR